jgi:hypothetical protein
MGVYTSLAQCYLSYANQFPLYQQQLTKEEKKPIPKPSGKLTEEEFKNKIKKRMIAVRYWHNKNMWGGHRINDCESYNVFKIIKVSKNKESFVAKQITDDSYRGNLFCYDKFSSHKCVRLLNESCEGSIFTYTILKNPKGGFMSNLIKKCKQLFLLEPEKSFRKAEITLDDGFLTVEGKEVFLKWMLAKHAEEFKKDIVDEIIDDMEKEKDKE